jgi:hypothetical protein
MFPRVGKIGQMARWSLLKIVRRKAERAMTLTPTEHGWLISRYEPSFSFMNG